MELKQLDQFKTIAKYENMSKAAEELYISQPGLSKAMLNLEDELKVKLFDRTKNSIALNDAGKIALQHVTTLFLQIEKMKTELMNFTNEDCTIRFCSSSSLCLRYILPMFNEYFPKIITTFHVVKQDAIENILINKIADIAISVEPITHPDIYVIPICEERLLISAPLTHPFSQRKSISLKELENQKIIRLMDSSYSAKYLDELLKKENINIDFYYQNDSLICREMIRTSDNLSFSSTLAKKQYFDLGPNRKYIIISDRKAALTYYVAYLKKKNTSTETFLDWMHSHIKDIMTT